MNGRRSAGSVLLVSVWAVSFFASVAVAQATRVGLQAKMIGRDLERLQAGNLARSGVAYALWQLAADAGQAWDAPREDWAHPERWAPQFAETDDTWTVTIMDAGRLVNLNTVSDDILGRVPSVAGITVDHFAERVRAALRDPQGQDTPLVHLEELVIRVGIRPEDVAKLAPLVRVRGGPAANLNTAGPEVLQILGLTPELSQAMCRARDRGVGTEDDVVFTSPDDVRNFLRTEMSYEPTSEPYQAVDRLITQGLVDVKSSIFSIDCVATTRRHGVAVRVSAVVERVGVGRPRIHRWVEEPWHET